MTAPIGLARESVSDWRARTASGKIASSETVIVANGNGNGRLTWSTFERANYIRTGLRCSREANSPDVEASSSTPPPDCRQADVMPQHAGTQHAVTEGADAGSHWVSSGPAGLAGEWDAEIINEIENKVLACGSLVAAGEVPRLTA